MTLPRFASYLLLGGLWQAIPQFCSAGILTDQVGYLPSESKIALVQDSNAKAFRVLDHATGRVVFEGRLGPKVHDPDTGRAVRKADFSPVTVEGEYVVEAPPGTPGRVFQIGTGAFRRAALLAMRSYYGQRCGTAVDMGPEFPGCSHGACHLKDGLFHASSGRTGYKAATRGWHDAGDYGKYVVNSGITTGTLLYAWELFRDRWEGVDLSIPESGGKLPDMLAEIRWNLDWMLCMQDTDGGVWHKLTSETFCPFIPPEADHDVRYIIGTGSAPYKSSAATADFAAVMAAASRIFRPYDPAFADRCLKAAEKTWPWLYLHPNVTFTNPPGVRTGGYQDSDCSDERLWAAVELWRATGGENYQRFIRTQVMRKAPRLLDPDNPPGWPQVAPMAYWSYALSGRSDADGAVVEAIRQATLATAREVAERTAKSPWRHSLVRQNYIWGSNSVALNYSVMLLIADRMEPHRESRDAAMDNLHYVLGRNAFDVCWVTRLGSNPFKYPHHRPSASLPVTSDNEVSPASGYVGAEPLRREDHTSKLGPWPGLMAGGPNMGKQDPALRRLPADTPPALCWVDERESYAGNEVAINWNAPLVFVLSAAMPPSPPRALKRQKQKTHRLKAQISNRQDATRQPSAEGVNEVAK